MGYGPIIGSGAVNTEVRIPMRRWTVFAGWVVSQDDATVHEFADEIEGNLAGFLMKFPDRVQLSHNDKRAIALLTGSDAYVKYCHLIAEAVRNHIAPTFTYIAEGDTHWVELAHDRLSMPFRLQMPPHKQLTADDAEDKAAAAEAPRPVAATQGQGGYTEIPPNGEFRLFYQTSLGRLGEALAAEAAATCMRDYQRLRHYFKMDLSELRTEANGVPAIFYVYIDEGSFGASHEYCRDTEIHCSTVMGAQPGVIPMMLLAEMVEVFCATRGNGWNCRKSNGEGLSRAIAASLYGNSFAGFLAGGYWLNAGKQGPAFEPPDWVSQTGGSDTELEPVGCAVLFLSYLHNQLGYGWPDIIAAGADTLAETYANLTRGEKANAFGAFFASLKQRYDPANGPVLLPSDDPFPI